jgi:antitoxin component of MazEF toxin-antitoxin module
MTVNVKKLGGSMAVIIPKAMAREMGLVEGSSLDVAATAEAIVMRKPGRRTRRPLGEIVSQIRPASYRRHTRDLGSDRPIGREVW